VTESDAAAQQPEQTPAANQGKDEPVPTTPDESSQAGSPDEGDGDGDAEASDAAAAGSSSRASQQQGDPPATMAVDDARGAANMSGTGSLPASATGGVPTPGDSHGVAVPAVQAAAGTSEESAPVDGVRITSISPPGKPDGEVDTRG
jgi:hypothetical protein